MNRTLTACKHRVSGSLSLPSRGSFHLSLTVLCAIGRHLVFRLGRWSSLLHAGFLVSCVTLVSAPLLTFSCTGLLPPLAALSIALPLKSQVVIADPQPRQACSSVWPLSLSLAATQEIAFCFLFLRVLRCFSSPGALLANYEFICGWPGIPLAGFPHSDISGSSLACSSPKLFAAGRVLHRRMAPWHPPCALCSLIFSSLS